MTNLEKLLGTPEAVYQFLYRYYYQDNFNELLGVLCPFMDGDTCTCQEFPEDEDISFEEMFKKYCMHHISRWLNSEAN